MAKKSGEDRKLSRRTVLQAGGVSSIALGLGGAALVTSQENEEENEGDETDDGANGAQEARRYNIGYENSEGGREAKEIAIEIYRDVPGINTLTVLSIPSDAQELSNSNNIRYVERDKQAQQNNTVSTAAVQQQQTSQTVPWGVDRIEAPSAHADGFRGETAHIAVLDSGVDVTHEDLQGNIGEGTAFTSCQGSCDESWDDDFGHGTHVAGTIGAIDNTNGVLGVGPEVVLHPVKVIDENNTAYPSDVASGLVWTADQGYDIANMSLVNFTPNTVMQDAIEYAHNEGVLQVASAGNNSGAVNYPASADEVIAVSAITPNDDLATFSSRGPEIELAAPGVDVLSTYIGNRYVENSGTSMAAPHVSGTAALLIAAGHPTDETREFMRATAEDLGLPSEYQGSGLVQASEIVEKKKKKGEKEKKSKENEEKKKEKKKMKNN